MSMSILGHYNNFFFAAHLLDIAMGFKTLRTILSSVTHNGKQVHTHLQLQSVTHGGKKAHTLTCAVLHFFCCGLQLVLTVGLLAVVVYLYTVVAFNFFRKFYNKGEDGELPDMKCDDMLTVSMRPAAVKIPCIALMCITILIQCCESISHKGVL